MTPGSPGTRAPPSSASATSRPRRRASAPRTGSRRRHRRVAPPILNDPATTRRSGRRRRSAARAAAAIRATRGARRARAARASRGLRRCAASDRLRWRGRRRRACRRVLGLGVVPSRPAAGRGLPASPALAATCADATSSPSVNAARSARAAASGSARLGQRPHDRDPARAPASRDRADVRRRRSRRSRRTGRSRARPRSGRARVRRPAVPAWSASRGRGRRRCSRRRACARRRSARGVCVEARRADRGRRVARASADGMSSWPTCTPSAPALSTRSGRSLRMNSAPWARTAAANRRAGGDDRLVVGVLDPQLHDVDAADAAPREELVGLVVADQVQAGAIAARWRRSVHGSQVWQEPSRARIAR